MKKIIFTVLASILAPVLIAYIFYLNNTSEADDPMLDEQGFQMSGYYYYGYLDKREKLDGEAEQEYFYYMDNHFEAYYDSIFSIVEEKEIDEDVEQYFQSIDGLDLYVLPQDGFQVENGDYISFTVKSPIMESYPARISKIDDFEVLHRKK